MREFKDLKLAVAGTGYVGLSVATLLAQRHHVTATISSSARSSCVRVKPSTITCILLASLSVRMWKMLDW